MLRLSHIADAVAFVLKYDTFGADHYLISLAPELSPLVWMLQAVLFCRCGLCFQLLLLLLGGHYSLRIEVVQNREVFDQLLDVRAEVAAAGRASQDVAGAQIHQAVLAEGVTAGKNARDLLFVIILIKANGTGDFHLSWVD